MIFTGISVGYMDNNCYFIGCEETGEAAVIDPGAEGIRILAKIEELKLKCRYIILTHGHSDHIGAIGEVIEATKAELIIHAEDAAMLTSADENLSVMIGKAFTCKSPDRLLSDGDIVQVGNEKLKIIHTPGHTLGGICVLAGEKLITGDTLFAGAIGRWDLPGGNHNQLIASIKKKLLILPPETKVYPGHGPSSSIGEELRSNPFF